MKRRKLVGAYVEHTNEEVCSLLEPTMSDSGSFVSPSTSLPTCLKKRIITHNSSFPNVPFYHMQIYFDVLVCQNKLQNIKMHQI